MGRRSAGSATLGCLAGGRITATIRLALPHTAGVEKARSTRRQRNSPSPSLRTVSARCPAHDDHTRSRFVARGPIYRNGGRRARDSKNRRRFICGVWLAIADVTPISKSSTPKSPTAGKGPVVSASTMQSPTMKTSTGRASAMKACAVGLGSSGVDRGGEGQSYDDSSHQ